MSDAHVDGFGSVTWWGFSPALNLIALHEQGKFIDYSTVYREYDSSSCRTVNEAISRQGAVYCS